MTAGAQPTEIPSVFSRVRRFPPPRRRGGQPGNRNRLRHGGFSRAVRARHAGVRCLVREMTFLIQQIESLGCLRKVRWCLLPLKHEAAAWHSRIRKTDTRPASEGWALHVSPETALAQ